MDIETSGGDVLYATYLSESPQTFLLIYICNEMKETLFTQIPFGMKEYVFRRNILRSLLRSG